MWQEWQNCVERQSSDTNEWVSRNHNIKVSHTFLRSIIWKRQKPVGTPWRGNEWPCHWCFGSGCRSRSIFGWECPGHSARWPHTLASTQTWRRRKGGSTRHGIWCARRSLSRRGPRDPPQPQLTKRKHARNSHHLQPPPSTYLILQNSHNTFTRNWLTRKSPFSKNCDAYKKNGQSWHIKDHHQLIDLLNNFPPWCTDKFALERGGHEAEEYFTLVMMWIPCFPLFLFFTNFFGMCKCE